LTAGSLDGILDIEMNLSEIIMSCATSVALFLSIINGFILFNSYLRDRPELLVDVIHPDVYQWFFVLPKTVIDGKEIRKYGFLAYIDVGNKGMRDTSLHSWYLYIKINLGKWVEFKPISIREPSIKLADNMKIYPVLGTRGPTFEGNTMVRSGSYISGFAYYVASFYGGDGWNPSIKDDTVTGKIIIKDIFGNRNSAIIKFSKIPLEKAQAMVPDIEKIV
jgi:hypothetical protein